MRPMPPVARRLSAVAALLLGLGIVAVLALRGMGYPIGAGVRASPTPVAATATPQPSGPAPSIDPLAVFAQIEEQVRELRGLPAPQIGPPEVVTRTQLAAMLPGMIEPPLDNDTLRAMGLLTADQDIAALTNQLYAAQVLGFYDSDAKRMVVVSDAGLTPAAEVTYAHEYTHALQDAAFDTGATGRQLAGQLDRALALLALEEGDASTAMVLWAIGHLSAAEVAGISSSPVPDMSGIPGWMVSLLEFPYLSGAEFVSQLYASGGWDGVNAAYADPPRSTEQVLHPAKYLAKELPKEVSRVDLLAGSCPTGTPCPSAFPGWSTVTDTTLGEEWIAIWLEGLGVDPAQAAAAADGWGGDRLTLAMDASGEWSLGWRIAWDAASEASQFETAYAGVQAQQPFATRLVHVSELETVVLQASSAEILNAIAPVTAE
jgi:hypothetical protein